MKFEDSGWKLEDFVIYKNTILSLSEKGINKLKSLEVKRIVFPDKLYDSYCCEEIKSILANEGQIMNTGEFININVDIVDFSNCINLKTIFDFAFSKYQIKEVIFKNCYNLERIKIGAFSGNEISSLDLSDCKKLYRICASAFSDNKIEELFFCENGDLETIEDYAFHSNKLSEVDFNILSNLLQIHDYAFMLNNLSYIDLSDIKNTVQLSEKAFISNPGVEHKQNFIIVKENKNVRLHPSIYSVKYPQNLGDYPKNTIMFERELKNNTFEWKSSDFKHKKDIIIGFNKSGYQKLLSNHGYLKIVPSKNNNITKIDNLAFTNSGIKHLDLTECNDLSYIGERAFVNNKIKDIQFPKTESLNIDKRAFSCNEIQKLDFSMIKNVSIENMAFSDNDIKQIDLSSREQKMLNINNSAFLNNDLHSIKLYDIKKLQDIVGAFVFRKNIYRIVDVFLENEIKEPYVRYNFIVNKYQLKKIKREWLEDDFLYKDENITGLSNRGFETLYLNNGFLKLKEKNRSNCLKIEEGAFKDLVLNYVDFSELKHLQFIDDESFSGSLFNSLDLSQNFNLKKIAKTAFGKQINYYSISKKLLDFILSKGLQIEKIFELKYGYSFTPVIFLNINNLTDIKKQYVKSLEKRCKNRNNYAYTFIFDNDFNNIIFSKPTIKDVSMKIHFLNFNNINDFVFEKTKIISYTGSKNFDNIIIPAYNLQGEEITGINKYILDRDIKSKKVFVPQKLLTRININDICANNEVEIVAY